MSSHSESVQWREDRVFGDGTREIVFVRAELDNGVWRFAEKPVWGIHWYEMPPTEELEQKALAAMRRKKSGPE